MHTLKNPALTSPVRTAIMLLALVAGILVVACGGEDAESTASTSTASESTSTGADSTTDTAAASGDMADSQDLVIRQYSEPVGFDPAFLFRIDTELVAVNIYSGLTTFDPDTAEPIPDLAESWDISDDGLVYTFHLVDNAEWHHGYGPLTAADVVYSYERVMDPANESPYAVNFSSIESITAPDDYTVEITLTQPDANFLYQVGNYHQGQIVKQEAIEEYGDEYPRNPVGTGPFYLEEWTPNSQMVLRAHEGYFKGRAKLDSLTFNLISDHSAAETALVGGEVDVMINVGGGTEMIDRIEAAPGMVLHANEQASVRTWLFGPEFEPFQDVRVRQAFAHAIDNQAVFEAVGPRQNVAWSSVVPSWMSAYDPSTEQFPYDPDLARDLLAEAGYPDGFTVAYVTTAPSDANLLQQSYLAEVGIDMVFEPVEGSVFNQRRADGTFEISHRGLPAVNPDDILVGYLHPDSGLNSFSYDNPAVTDLLAEARSTLDHAARMALYHEIQQIVAEEIPYLGISSNTNYWGASEKVMGLQIGKLSQADFFPVYIAN